MKKQFLKSLSAILVMLMLLTTLASCGEGKEGPAGQRGEQGIQGEKGDKGEQGIQGEPGANGINGANGKSAYEIAIENGYEGTVQEWLMSLIGESGANGQVGSNGLSAYEIAVKNGYIGTEIEWLASLVGASGNDGEAGEQGVGVINAYVDENLHLWIVLSNGTQIDAGYVGVQTIVPQPETYMVVFKDYDGTVLKTEIVESGASATPPSAPARDGYEFKSWSGIYINITADQTVVATYTQKSTIEDSYIVTFYDYDGVTVLGRSEVEVGESADPPANPSKAGATFLGWSGQYVGVSRDESVTAVYSDSKNVFVVESTSGSVGDTVTLLVSVDGTVKICGFDLMLYYDNTALELASYDSDLDLDVVVNSEYLDNGILLNFSAAKEKIKSRDIIALTFVIKDAVADATRVNLEMTSIKEIDSDAIIDSTYKVVGGVVTIQ